MLSSIMDPIVAKVAARYLASADFELLANAWATFRDWSGLSILSDDLATLAAAFRSPKLASKSKQVGILDRRLKDLGQKYTPRIRALRQDPSEANQLKTELKKELRSWARIPKVFIREQIDDDISASPIVGALEYDRNSLVDLVENSLDLDPEACKQAIRSFDLRGPEAALRHIRQHIPDYSVQECGSFEKFDAWVEGLPRERDLWEDVIPSDFSEQIFEDLQNTELFKRLDRLIPSGRNIFDHIEDAANSVLEVLEDVG